MLVEVHLLEIPQVLHKVGVGGSSRVAEFRVERNAREVVRFEKFDLCHGRLAGKMDRFFFRQRSHGFVLRRSTAQVAINAELSELVLADPGENSSRHSIWEVDRDPR